MSFAGRRAPVSAGAFAVLAVGSFAVLSLLPGLGDAGFWSGAELGVLDRAAAATGEARTGLVRAPALPDLLRTFTWSKLGGELGLRLPHALAVAITAAACTWLARARGATAWVSVAAGVIALSMPALAIAGRTVMGDPFGECFGVLAVVAALAGERAAGPRRALGFAAALVAIAAAVASAGLLLGGLVPGFAMLAMLPATAKLRRRALAAGLLVAAAISAWLVVHQGDGFIPLLGAAKDLELVDKPELRRFTAALSDLGHQSFPWLPLAVVGLALGRDRGLAGWLLGGVVMCSAWSLIYGLTDVPLRVPVAIAAAGALASLSDPRAERPRRRAAVLLAVFGTLALAKDLELAPETIAVPLHAFAVNEYPADLLGTAAQLGRFAKLLALVLVVGLALAPGDDDGRRWSRVRARVPAVVGEHAAVVLALALAAAFAWQQTHGLLRETSAKLSPRAVLDHFAGLVEAGELEPTLGTHRVRDRGLALYGPASLEPLPNRREIYDRLAGETPTAVLLRALDVPAVYQQHRQHGVPMFVLDDTHEDLRLISNVLPAGEVDHNRILEVLFDAPPALEHETLVRFEEFVEVIAWQIDAPIVRGRRHTVQMVLRVLKPVPGGAKMFARLLGGRLSRMNPDAQPLAEDLYPCNLWRPGDYILHRASFDAPLTEVPGSYDLVIGLRRGETKNFEISVPAGADGEFGVHIDDPKRGYARIGTVTAW
ncbi:MAG: hypothetical protein IPK74_18000 [Deltaproteobacteria bacterium]|nr:hypothetical protein [Deltaproteobacteria bacterium]